MEILNTFKKTLENLLLIGIIIFIGLLSYYFYKSLFWKPYDDATNHLLFKDEYWKSIQCEGNTCNITFDSNVSYVSSIDMTSSMLPTIGGSDVIICLNKTPKVGDIVSLGNILHTVYKIEEETWIISKGENNLDFDRFKYPIDQIDCVVSVVVR